MGGRERRRSRVRRRDWDRWFPNRRGTLEEPSTRSRRRASRGRDRGPEKAIVKGRNIRSCTLVILFSETVLEEPSTAGEGFHMGLDSETRDGRDGERESPMM